MTAVSWPLFWLWLSLLVKCNTRSRPADVTVSLSHTVSMLISCFIIIHSLSCCLNYKKVQKSVFKKCLYHQGLRLLSRRTITSSARRQIDNTVKAKQKLFQVGLMSWRTRMTSVNVWSHMIFVTVFSSVRWNHNGNVLCLHLLSYLYSIKYIVIMCLFDKEWDLFYTDNDNVKVCTLSPGSGDRILFYPLCSLTDKYQRVFPLRCLNDLQL